MAVGDGRAIDQSSMPPSEGSQASQVEKNEGYSVTDTIPVGFSHSLKDVPTDPRGQN